jgi:hypothetical protein
MSNKPKKEYTAKNIASFIRGTSKKLLDDVGFVKLPEEQQVQVMLRSLLCDDCLAAGACKKCGCNTPDMFYDPYKECEDGKWGKMMSKEELERFQDESLEIIKNAYKDYYSGEQKTDNELDPIDAFAAKKVVIDNGLSEEESAKLQTFSDSLGDIPDSLKRATVNQKKKDIIKMIDITPKNNIHDFGDVIFNTGSLTKEFKFKNTSSETLQIDRANSSCGCTKPSYTRTPVAPGEEFSVKLTYNNKSVGMFNKFATVSFTNKNIIPVKLTVKGFAYSNQKQMDAANSK